MEMYVRDDRKFSTTLRLQAYARDILSKRRELPSDPEELRKRNSAFREKLVELLGGFPEQKCPLNPVKVFETDLGDYICERVYFDSEPTATIPALVYKPKDTSGKKPAVILVHGYPQRKEEFPGFKALMVKAGYIVISFDVLSHGERRIVADTGSDVFNAIGYSLAIGKPLLGMCVWDIMRVVDYLQTRDDVDPNRIGIIGLCMGGQQVWYSGALDERLKVCVVVCGTSTYEAMVLEMTTYHSHCLFTYVPNILRYGDTQDVLALIAPRPLLIMNNYNDTWFPVSGYRKVCRELERVYKALGVPDRFKHIIRNTYHDITPEFGQIAKEWFDKYL
jgi:dienelactone hydrolase